MSEKRAVIVADLGFGDAGKGTITDHLVRASSASIVLRTHGGAQAGHNVVLDDGRHHTFAQLGAGSFVPGVRTLLGASMVVHPLALALEARVFAAKAGTDPLARVIADEDARITTPFHQAAGRLRELARGEARHGSCGVGVGETVAHAEAHPDEAITIGMLARDPIRALVRLARIRARLADEFERMLPRLESVAAAEPELEVFADASLATRFVEDTRPVLSSIEVADARRIAALLGTAPSVVCEGAQGVLLDEWHGMHPHTTYSTCTFDSASAALERYGFSGEVTRLGVLRTYLVRHGEGPFPSESSVLDSLPEPHNDHGPWQGVFRRGFLDLPLLRYAIECCGGVDALALTHLDAVDRIPAWSACVGYELDDATLRGAFEANDGGVAARLRVARSPDLSLAELRTRALFACRPRFEPIALGAEKRQSYIDYVEAKLGVAVALTSEGPKPSDKRPRAGRRPNSMRLPGH